MSIRKVAVIGAGTMGSGIAGQVANAGIEVWLLDLPTDDNANALAERGLERGIHLSFSGIVTFNSAKDVQEAALLCPSDKLLVETDSPYLAPVPHRGKQNRPVKRAYSECLTDVGRLRFLAFFFKESQFGQINVSLALQRAEPQGSAGAGECLVQVETVVANGRGQPLVQVRARREF